MTKKGNQTGYELDQDPELIYNPGFADGGNAPDREGTVTPGTGQDLSKGAKMTLGNYLSAASRGAVSNTRAQSYQVSADSRSAVAGVDPNASSRISPAEASAQMQSGGTTIGTFMDVAKGYDPSQAERFNSTKDSSYSVAGNNPFLDSGVNVKNYSSPNERSRGQDGNSILSSIKAQRSSPHSDLGNPHIGVDREDAPIIQKKISEVLRQNRFNPIEKAFVENHTRKVPGGYTVQKKLGVFTQGEDAPEVDEKKLKEVGLQLLVRATGHGVPGADLLNPTNTLQQFSNLAPMIPSLTQFSGLPLIDTVNLRAGNVAITSDDASSNPARTDYINQENPEFSTFSGKSYGVLNSHFEPFDGPLPVGTLITTVAGILAIVGFSVVIAAVPMLVGGGEANTSLEGRAPSDYRMGRRGLVTDDTTAEFFLNLFGIPKTDHNWGKCLLVGLGAFLGFGGGIGSGVTFETILEGAYNLATAPGYYAVVIRNAIRDTEQVVKATEDFAANIANESAVLAVSSFFKIVESITTSATYRFVMTMVGIGNQVLNDENPTSVNVNNLGYYAPSRHMKSRIGVIPDSANIPDMGSPQKFALAWKHSSAPSRYLLPSSFVNADIRINSGNPNAAISTLEKVAYKPNGTLPKLPDGSDSSATVGSQNRIPVEYVRELEDKLESEYMPFYFHDLRTNEIISFHAFLVDLSDGFTAGYTSTSAYGRIEDVMVYNNTKRSISFTFFVAATSEADHSVMYWNINKLVSMLYPQFSRGRAMQSGNGKFIQPFSQIPTASPMIRLRIGDVIKGNYSKFGIARLFGLGQPASVFNRDRDDETPSTSVTPSPTTTATSSPTAEQLTAAMASLNDIRRQRPEIGWIAEDKVYLNTTSTYQFINLEGVAAPRSVVRGSGRKRYTSPPEVEIVRVIDNSAGVSPSAPARSPGSRSGRRRREPPDPNKRYIVKVNSPDAREVSNQSFLYHEVPHSSILGMTRQREQQLLQRILNNSSTTASTAPAAAPAPTPNPTSTERPVNYQNLQRFLGAENPLIRSFESTAGRGLAGFITDLKLDWADAPWDTRKDSRAPMFMKVSVSFSPIHDIPMGLDSDGMMRSVAYNVGDLSGIVGRDAHHDYQTSVTKKTEWTSAANNAMAEINAPPDDSSTT